MPREMSPAEVSALLSKKPAEKPAPIAEPKLAPATASKPEPKAATANTVATPPAAVKEEYKRLKRTHIVARADNPRKRIDVEKPSFKDLVLSVQGPEGVITPVIVRPHPTLKDKYELLAGHRRHRACEVGNVEELPALVKHLDDWTAKKVMCMENFDREDLTPLEEARAYQLLLDKDHRIEQLSVQVKKDRSHIARRVQLLKLNAKWLGFAEEYEIPAKHLELVARMDEAAQERLWKRLRLDFGKKVADWQLENVRDTFFGPGSFPKFKAQVGDEMQDLSLAPWALDDALLLPKIGACAVCPKRSGCQPDLFSEEEFTSGNRCLDTDCWGDKMEAFKKRREAELKKEYPKLVRVLGNHNRVNYEERKKLGALESYDYKKVGAKTKDAQPAFVMAGEGEGTLIWITKNSNSISGAKKKESGAAKQAKASLDPKEAAKLLKEKQEAHEKRRWAWVCGQLQEMLFDNELPVHAGMRSPAALCELVRVFGTDDCAGEAGDDPDWDRLMNVQPGALVTLQTVWEMVRPRIKQCLQVYTVGELHEGHHAAIKGACWLLGIKVADMKEDADKEIPEPQSWNQLRKLTEAPPPAGKKAAKGPDKKGEQKGTKKTKAADGGMMADRQPAVAVGKPGEGFMSRGRRAAGTMEVPGEWAAEFLEDDEDEDDDDEPGGGKPDKKPAAKKAAAKKTGGTKS